MKTLAALLVAYAAGSGVAQADGYLEYPAPAPGLAAPPSVLSGDYVIVPPYGPLPVRIYATPQQQPFYNVPPYRVIAPF